MILREEAIFLYSLDGRVVRGTGLSADGFTRDVTMAQD